MHTKKLVNLKYMASHHTHKHLLLTTAIQFYDKTWVHTVHSDVHSGVYSFCDRSYYILVPISGELATEVSRTFQAIYPSLALQNTAAAQQVTN